MGAKWDNVTAGTAALGTNVVAGAASMAVGSIVGALTRSRATGYVVAGVVQSIAMLGVGAHYATKHPRYAGGVSTLGVGSGLATIAAGAYLGALDGPDREALASVSAPTWSSLTQPTHPASAGVYAATQGHRQASAVVAPQASPARPDVIDLKPLGRTKRGVERFGL